MESTTWSPLSLERCGSVALWWIKQFVWQFRLWCGYKACGRSAYLRGDRNLIWQLVQKAFAGWSGEIEDLIELAAKGERSLMVGHAVEYNPAVMRVEELLRGGEVRDIHYVHSSRVNLGPAPLRGVVGGAWSLGVGCVQP